MANWLFRRSAVAMDRQACLICRAVPKYADAQVSSTRRTAAIFACIILCFFFVQSLLSSISFCTCLAPFSFQFIPVCLLRSPARRPHRSSLRVSVPGYSCLILRDDYCHIWLYVVKLRSLLLWPTLPLVQLLLPPLSCLVVPPSRLSVYHFSAPFPVQPDSDSFPSSPITSLFTVRFTPLRSGYG